MLYTLRKARSEDSQAIEALIALSARGLSTNEYTHEQVEGALRGAFGLDSQLVSDGTYFVAESDGRIVGCGGWSKRKTLFGGDKHNERDADELNPAVDAARIRAFFVHPDWARKGIARLILDVCEAEARVLGFCSLELMSTLPGLKFYAASGFEAGEPVKYPISDTLTIEFVPMRKSIVL
ncbi:MAG: GNAT family N-acetyltransferase [Bacteroidota bacterium]